MSDLAAALAELQANLPRIPKGRKVQAGARQYRYAEYDKILRDVRPVLHKFGFVWNSKPTMAQTADGNTRFVLDYTLVHVATGDCIAGIYPLTEGPPQTMGAQISYAKRYALVAVLDLEVEGEDTDAMDTPPRPVVRSGRSTGAEHERLRYGTVEATPEDRPARRGPLSAAEDVWSGPGPDAEDEPGSIGASQQKAMFAAFKQIGCNDRAKRLELTRTILKDSTIGSSNELSYHQAGLLLTALHELAASK
jgi:hypothetical protein